MSEKDHDPLWSLLFIGTVAVAAFAAWLWATLMPAPAHAREGGDWSQVDPEVREWIQSLKMPDNPTMSCCGLADAYEADLGEQTADGQNFAIITGTRGNPLPVGTRLWIPPRKVQNRQGNPTDHVIVFANTSGTVYCFIPNGGL